MKRNIIIISIVILLATIIIGMWLAIHIYEMNVSGLNEATKSEVELKREKLINLYKDKSNGATIRAFLQEGSSEAQLNEVKRIVLNIEGVTEVKILTKEDALNDMKTKFKYTDILESYEGDNNIFPESLLITIDDYRKGSEIEKRISSIEIDGNKIVESIKSNYRFYEEIESMTEEELDSLIEIYSRE